MLWERIEYLLDKKEWTIYRLTKEANLSQNLLYELKNGRSSDLHFSSVCKIADALEVSLDQLREDRSNGKKNM